MEPDFQDLSIKMVNEQLITRNIKSPSILEAMKNVPRHLFVPKSQQKNAYCDSPLPIGWGQTISQPYIVAFMSEQLEPAVGMKILEIGTGSGYQAAILAYLGCEVFTIELVKELADNASNAFRALNIDNVRLRLGSGYSGWPEEAPFDAIIVTAAPDELPETLIEQLREGGKMIIPVGEVHSVQILKLITKKEGIIIEDNLLPVRFVPLVKS
jgi:protein-L-isoaspartate(D-aspartate) O-methyltransferase